jgi:hypothetical protein
MERKYSYSEIEEMRRCLTSIEYLQDGCYNAEERSRAIEDKLRTAILAGIEPHEIQAEYDRRYVFYMQSQARWEERQRTSLAKEEHPKLKPEETQVTPEAVNSMWRRLLPHIIRG